MKYVVSVGGREIEVAVDGERVTVDGREHAVTSSAVTGTPLRHVVIDGRAFALPMAPAGRGRWEVTSHGERWEVDVVDERTRYIRSLTGGGRERAGAGALKAPMPGLVVRVQVEPGQEVAAGAGVIVLEAMKMENELRAPAAAAVRAVLVHQGQAVEKGQVLVEFEGS